MAKYDKADIERRMSGAVESLKSDLGGLRLLLREARKGEIADGILTAVKAGVNCPPEDMPKVADSNDKLKVNPALADLLRVLLKAKTAESDVAQKLIASANELDAIAAGQRDIQRDSSEASCPSRMLSEAHTDSVLALPP